MTECTLCGLPADPSVTDGAVDGEFCCRGCLEVYRRLGDVAVDEQGDVRGAPVGGTDGGVDTEREGAETAYLAVDGMHCSTCEVFLESVARDHEGVLDAEASYAAETMKLVYDPEQVGKPELPSVVSGLGYRASPQADGSDADQGPETASRLLVGGLFGMMAMVWYAVFLYPRYFGFDPVVTLGRFDGAYLYGQLAVVTAIILLYTGAPMLRGAYVSVRAGRPNVDLLVTVAAVAAYLYSTGRLLVGGTDLYYDVTIVVVMAVTVGNYYEERIKRRTAGLLSDLTRVQVDEATRADGGTVPVSEVEADDELLVAPGERIPVDGTVSEGTAAVDEALVTGESVPETKRPGDSVRGGTVVTDAPLVVTADAGGDSTLDRIVGMLWEIQASRPGAQRVADRLATVFVPLVLTVALVVAGWLLLTGGTPRVALLTGLTVVIVSCPCALGLATPLAVASGLQSAAERGAVVATPALFEHADDVDVVVFDKTGTLTEGDLAVTGVHPVEPSAEELLYRAGAVEGLSEHPIADAIVERATAEDRPAADRSVDVDSFEPDARGVSAVVDGDRVLVGHPALFREREWRMPAPVGQQVATVREGGETPVVVGWHGLARGVIAVGEQPRTGWEAVASRLGETRRIVVLTGDDSTAGDRLADHPAVDEVFAGVPPDGKAETVRRLAATETVAMVGDGSNDAPALAAADVGIALEGGTQLATEAADAVVLDGDLRGVPAVLDVAAGTQRRIRENLAWAFLYNGVAIPLAVTGLLNPLLAAVAMASSSLVVVANSARGTPAGDAEEVETAREGESQEPQGETPTAAATPVS
jgi:Cu2+-exporting ATPase